MQIKILVVEDECIVALDFQLELEKMGNDVKTVPSGETALEEMDKIDYDLVFMDISLNGKLDGIETARIIKDKNPDIHVVFVTGREDLSEIESINRYNHYKYISKPLEENKLKEIIENYILEVSA
ncbi:MAG: response regulator [Methanobacterium sp.]